MKALLKNYRQSPRKVRLLANLICKKDVKAARLLLNAASKRAALPMRKLLDSAVSNASQGQHISEENLFVKEVRVDEGPTLKRMMPRARGSAFLIKKRTSRIMLSLGQKEQVKKSDTEIKKSKHPKNLNPKS